MSRGRTRCVSAALVALTGAVAHAQVTNPPGLPVVEPNAVCEDCDPIVPCGYETPYDPCVTSWRCDRTTGEWVPTGYAAAGAGCDDGNACTHTDRCSATHVCQGTAITCTSDSCTKRTCNGTSSCAIAYEPPTKLCNDGALCTHSDHCSGAGQCVGTAITCPSDTCTTRACNGTAACTVSYKPSSTPCNDGQLCTHTDRCNAGLCQGTAISCISDTCAARSCNGSSSCTVSLASTSTQCNDLQLCTHSDRCDGLGACRGVSITCTSNECATRTCNGTPQCSVSFALTGSPCMDDPACGCNGAGACAFPKDVTAYCYDGTGNITSRTIHGAGQACVARACPQ